MDKEPTTTQPSTAEAAGRAALAGAMDQSSDTNTTATNKPAHAHVIMATIDPDKLAALKFARSGAALPGPEDQQ